MKLSNQIGIHYHVFKIKGKWIRTTHRNDIDCSLWENGHYV